MKTTFKVKHLDCTSCAMVMEGICEDTPGVKKAEVNAGKRQLIIEHDELVELEMIKKALDKEGYPVEEVTE